MFYHFHQNNSGGFYQEGMPHNLFIEAPSASEANRIAQENGVYFDPEYERDCECCGTRWTEAWDGCGTEGLKYDPYYQLNAKVYYLDGSIKPFPTGT